jgi:hypothetical protein
MISTVTALGVGVDDADTSVQEAAMIACAAVAWSFVKAIRAAAAAAVKGKTGGGGGGNTDEQDENGVDAGTVATMTRAAPVLLATTLRVCVLSESTDMRTAAAAAVGDGARAFLYPAGKFIWLLLCVHVYVL